MKKFALAFVSDKVTSTIGPNYGHTVHEPCHAAATGPFFDSDSFGLTDGLLRYHVAQVLQLDALAAKIGTGMRRYRMLQGSYELRDNVCIFRMAQCSMMLGCASKPNEHYCLH